MTDAQAALAQVREALAAMRGDWLGDGFTKLRRSQIVAVLDEQAAEISGLRSDLESYIAAANGYLADVAAQAAEIKRLRGLAMSTELFEDAPCFLCGYNGPGYFQPEQHSCAALYHERRREQR